MTGISDEKLISQQVKAFLVAARKRAFCLKLHLFDDEVTLKSRGSMDRFIQCINFLRASIFFRHFYFIIDVADDPSMSPTPKSATIAPKIMRSDSFAFPPVADAKFSTIKIYPHYPNLHWHGKRII